MINNLPKSLIEVANSILIEKKFKSLNYKLHESFYFDDILSAATEFIDILNETFDSEMPLHDVTHIAKQDNPERFEYYRKNGVNHVKVEYNPETNEVIHTLYRDGAWEIHHQAHGISGEKIQSNKPPVKFIGKMFQFIKDKIDSGEKVRISATPDMIENYHKISHKIANKHGGASVTEIENGIDFHRIGKPVKEFYIYPSSLNECVLPLFFKTIHESMRFAKKHFPESPKLLEYESNLRKQGHQL